MKRASSIDVLHRVAVGLACALAAGACVPDASTEASTEASTAASTAAIGQRASGGHTVDDQTVTLLTGDRVTLRDGRAAVTLGPGRAHLRFTVSRDRGHVHVVPSDAAPLIASGQLDPALFDVTELLASGYGDSKRADLPLILTGAAPGASLAGGVIVDRALPALHMVVARQPKAAGAALTRSLVATFAGSAGAKIWLDRKHQPLLDRSVPQIGGDVAHARGFTGTGVTVAVLDTGVDATHPDLADRVVLAEDFTGDGAGVSDVVGHGTHVASIIAGTGAASGGQFAGVAPGAQLISGRVCTPDGCPFSAMLAGMAWAAIEQRAPIINMSIGGPDGPGLDPLEEAVNTLSAQTGALFVIAAGNDGADGTIESPGSADAALTVGAIDRDESLAPFSSRGPRTGDGAIKPDLTAPGVGIVAARASSVDPIGPPVGTAYMRLSGTSMATPHVAGGAALLRQQHPDWTGAQLKAQLIASANPNPALGAFAQGAGRIDLDRGTRQDVSAEPSSLNLGVARFPHDDDPPIVRVVHYHNGGTAAITLAVTAALTGPAGPAPISVAPATITVPAGGTSDDVVVTARTDGALADGRYTGALVATAGDVRVETAVAVEREVESFDLTLVGTANGEPAISGFSLTPVGGTTQSLFAPDGTATARVPRGQYAITGSVNDDRGATLVLPRYQAAASATLRFEAALAAPVQPDLGDPSLVVIEDSFHVIDFATGFELDQFGFSVPVATGQLGPDLPPDELVSWVNRTVWDSEDVAAKNVYYLAHATRGHVTHGWDERIAPHQLAVVDAHVAGRADAEYLKGTAAVYEDPRHGLVGVDLFALNVYDGPFDRTEHYFGEGFVWAHQLLDVLEDGTSTFFATPVARYRAGQRVRELWNHAPFGPAFPRDEIASGPGVSDPFVLGSTATRTGDVLRLAPTMAADNASPPRPIATLFDHRRVALLRDGVQIFEAIDGRSDVAATVPAGLATYRLESTIERPAALFPRSTRVTAAWTFRSARAADDRLHSLPVMTMRFDPALDDDGATAVRVLVLPIRFERAPDAGRPVVVHADLEASFDDGAHWSRVPLAVVGDRAIALVVHPRAAARVALRGSATDREGNRVEQEILDAYGVTR